jgi:S1-C subfamily serine protease
VAPSITIRELSPAEILRHFFVDIDGPKNPPIKDLESLLLQEHLRNSVDIAQVLRCIHKLIAEGYLIEAAVYIVSHPIMSRRFINHSYSQQKADNGEYDCVVKGWGEVYRRFKDSILPVEVVNAKGDEDIGTCFLAGNNVTLFTSRHVIDGVQKFRILTSADQPIAPQKVVFPKRKSLDIAVILMTPTVLGTAAPFRLTDYQITEEVLCLGYPPIPGFKSVLVAETGEVSANLKAVAGNVVSSDNSYLDGEEYVLVSNRIKGGNSGGPVVNTKGYVIGMVTSTAVNAEDTSKVTDLGYGLLTPKSSMLELLKGPENPNPEIEEFGVKSLGHGWFRISG